MTVMLDAASIRAVSLGTLVTKATAALPQTGDGRIIAERWASWHEWYYMRELLWCGPPRSIAPRLIRARYRGS